MFLKISVEDIQFRFKIYFPISYNYYDHQMWESMFKKRLKYFPAANWNTGDLVGLSYTGR